MIRIAICDDMKSSLDEISSLVKEYFSSRSSAPYIAEEYTSPLPLVESNKAYDILILDIIMPSLSGTEIARRILGQNPESRIIFISSSRDYAVDAFALGAVHYITKPVGRRAFEEAMNRAMESLKQKEGGKLMINMRNSMVQSVECSKIIYIESIGYTRIVHTAAGNYEEVKQTLSALYEELEKMGLSAPQITYLMGDLKKRGFDVDDSIGTVEAAKAEILMLWKGKQKYNKE